MDIIEDGNIRSIVYTNLNFPRPLFYFSFHINFVRHNVDGSVHVRYIKVTRECERDGLIGGGVQATVDICELLKTIGVPCYRQLVKGFKKKRPRTRRFFVPAKIPKDMPPGNANAIKYLLSPAEPPTSIEKAEYCSICMRLLAYGVGEDECVRLPLCNHGFHKPCIKTWLEVNSSCANCRSFFPI
ncbi:hypothetical protein ARALYDRAFT_904942 [Arabidopsis lyrata subsp. lyrata]|uniref:RING-type domain-containing protein n=1 Tax=Arabidopsis lyrata subsp. lyrata TaxID=81972 RepID=D7LLY1_ARALL|nr:hypothetical protein ARALYDRAFT_904942 [Arabidopsis lyrata subsp. lyrata]